MKTFSGNLKSTAIYLGNTVLNKKHLGIWQIHLKLVTVLDLKEEPSGFIPWALRWQQPLSHQHHHLPISKYLLWACATLWLCAKDLIYIVSFTIIPRYITYGLRVMLPIKLGIITCSRSHSRHNVAGLRSPTQVCCDFKVQSQDHRLSVFFPVCYGSNLIRLNLPRKNITWVNKTLFLWVLAGTSMWKATMQSLVSLPQMLRLLVQEQGRVSVDRQSFVFLDPLTTEATTHSICRI